MSLLKWKPAYSLAIPSVDLEHREMINLINECYEQLGENRDPGAIEEFLGEIYSQISAHFALEELAMRKAGFAEYADHKADHERLLDEIRDLMDVFYDDADEGTRQLQVRLADWFGRHFSTFDSRLHDQLH